MKKYLIPLFYIWLMHNCLTVSAQDSIRIVPIRYHPSITDATKPKVYSSKDTLLPSIASAGLGSFQPSPSPETAQLNYRQDIPVNKFTGTPSINIPIYTLNEAGLSLPLNLSYNASGIRGHQLSGWSGLGWEITGIPTISRVVRGLPDEGSYEMTSPTTYIEKRGFLTGYNDDDKESDLYFLNLHGVVYKFAFDAAGRSIFFPENDIYVTSNLIYRNGSSIIKQFQNFKVGFPDGSTYYFYIDNSESTAEIEVEFAQQNQIYPPATEGGTNSQNFVNFIKNTSITSVWYCSRMANVNSLEINIEYNHVRYSYYRVNENEFQSECATTVDKKINRVFVQGVSPSRIKGIDTYINFNDGFTSCITLPHPATLQPQEYCVTWGIPNREDIDGWLQSPANSSNAKLLKNIAVYDRSTPNEKVTWTFNYGYFEGENNSGFDLPPGSAYSYSGANPVGITHKKRLKLSSVVFPDSTSSTFNYYGEDTGFNFKTRFTYGLDHWGYINGNDGNIQNYGLIGSDELASCGANRSTNSVFLRYGSLEKITNSTGNETHFEYEPNFASNYGNGLIPIGGLRIKSIRNKDLIRNTDIKTEYDYNNAGISTGFLCLAPIYRFDKPNGYRVANSALYDILLAETGRPTVGYSQVAERTIDVANSIQSGKIVEYFDQSLEQLTLAKEGEECFFDENLQEMVCFTTLVYPLNYFIIPPDFTNGNLIKQEVFNEANQKLSEVNYTYTPNNGIKTDSVFYVRRVRLNGIDNTKQYYLHQKKYRMEETTKKLFSQDGSGVPMTSTVAVTYKDEMPQSYRDTYKGKHNLPVKTTTTDTYGRTVEALVKFVADFTFGTDTLTMCEPDCYQSTPCACQYQIITHHSPPYGSEAYELYLNRIRNAVVETTLKRNNKVAAATYNTFVSEYPHKIYTLRTIPKTDFEDVFFQQSTDLMVKDNGYGVEKFETYYYTGLGLINTIKPKYGPITRFEWTNSLPIGNSGYPRHLLREKIENDGTNDTHTTSYEYQKAFQGISKITTPNGLELKYNYRVTDSKIDTITDKFNNVLKHYIYHPNPTN